MAIRGGVAAAPTARRTPRGEGPRSKGCFTCKSRRVKCDEKKPACIRCTRAGRQCGGYLDAADLIFRDENARLDRKLKAAKLEKSIEELANVSTWETSKIGGNGRSNLTALVDASIYVPSNVEPPLEPRVLSYFAYMYIMPDFPGGLPLSGYLQCLPILYSQADANSHLAKAVCATAFAYMGTEQCDVALISQARQHYATALASINLALADPETARRDDTLLAVHMLSVYETLMRTSKSLYAWNNHVIGASTLIRMRGLQQLQSPMGLSLFLLHRPSTVISCFARRKQLFPFVEHWSTHDPNDHPGISIMKIVCKTPAYLERMDHIKANAFDVVIIQAKISALFEEVKELDEQIEQRLMTLPDLWMPRITFFPQHSKLALPPDDVNHPTPLWSDFHAYANIWVGSVVNFARVARIHLRILMLECAEYLKSHSSSPLLDKAGSARTTSIIQTAVTDICSSLAFGLGYEVDVINRESEQEIGLTHRNERGLRPTVRTLGGYFLVWPMYVLCAVARPFLPREQEMWALGWLKYLCDVRDMDMSDVFRISGDPTRKICEE